MNNQHPPQPLTPKHPITLPIHGIGSNGEGVGYLDGFTVFVDGALPGEVVEARLVERHKRYGRGQLTSIVTPSPHRIAPPCKLFGKCGGCQLMHLSYPEQLKIKQQRVIDALRRIGKIEDAPVAPCLPSPSSLGYRNKIQLPVRQGKNGIELGLYARSSHELVEVDTCAIHCPLGEQVYKEAKSIIQQSGIRAYDPIQGSGELRHLLIKTAVHTQEVLVILITNGEQSPILQHIAKAIMKQCPQVKGVIHNIHTGRDNVILGRTYNVLQGQASMTEELCGKTFKVSPASFFQVNPLQAENLYAKALEFAALTGEESVLDAYCGVGTLSLLFASKAKRVIGVECVPEAIEDAKENAQLNGIQNITFVCAPAETHIQTLSDIDLILLNPPRRGCEEAFLDGIGALQPKTVIYISCDPATLARDIALLRGYGYQIEAIQPFDMFPQTAHVECVTKLQRA